MIETVAPVAAAIATTIAALMVAANRGARITGIGFIVFAVGSVFWMLVGATSDQASLLWQNAILLAINLFGAWRWLGLRARYDRGAEAAADPAGPA